jgi:hypothetical protein
MASGRQIRAIAPATLAFLAPAPAKVSPTRPQNG